MTDADTITGVRGVDENMLRRGTPFLVLTQTTTAQYEGIDSWRELSRIVEKFADTTLTLTESIITNPELLSSLERAIDQLEPGKLLTDRDVFGDEDDGVSK